MKDDGCYAEIYIFCYYKICSNEYSYINSMRSAYKFGKYNNYQSTLIFA